MLIDMVNLTPLNCSYQFNSLHNLNNQIDIQNFNYYSIYLNKLSPLKISINDFISYPPDEQLNNWDEYLIGTYKDYIICFIYLSYIR